MKIKTPCGPLELPDSARTDDNRKLVVKTFNKDGNACMLKISIRWDDSCKNGHNSFAITADLIEHTPHGKMESGGCLHAEIAEHAPELAFCIPYHLVSADGPLHYFANATFLAGDRDFNGAKSGEQRIHPTRGPMWQLEQSPYQIVYGADKPEPLCVPYGPVLGEGKAPQYDLARRILNWPDATEEQLALPEQELTALLTAKNRLPGTTTLMNAQYAASAKDCFGFLEGEQKRTKDGVLQWKMLERPFERMDSATEPPPKLIHYAPMLGEGKNRELASARISAVWPTATEAELSVEKAELEKALFERLPALMAEFKSVIEKLGFVY